MPLGYYNGFDVVTHDVNGIREALKEQSFGVVEIIGETTVSLGNVVSDESGFIPSGSFNVSTAGAMIRFKHANYDATFTRMVAATLEIASWLPENADVAFVVENLFLETTHPQIAEIWIKDIDNTGAKPVFLGYATAGMTTQIPYQSAVPQNLKVYALPVEGIEKKFKRIEDAPSADVVVSSAARTAFTVIAGEALSIGNLVNLYVDAGVLKARKASAVDNTKPAEGFVDSTVILGAQCVVYFGGNIISGFEGLTVDAILYLSAITPGSVTNVAPTGVGKIIQQVGRALSATTMIFEPQPTIELRA